jgi:hypothetical protein
MAKKYGDHSNTSLDMENLQNGIYILQIRDENKIINKKVILEK